MKFLVSLLLVSTCLAIPQTDTASSNLDRRNAEPLEARARCHAAIYETKAICKDNCGRHGKCHKTTAGHPVYWQCKCPRASAREAEEEELSKRVAEPVAVPEPEDDVVAEELDKRVAEPEPEAEADVEEEYDVLKARDNTLESRADIEARAKCVPGSYGKKKKSCTPHCKGKGKCSKASSPGIGFVWVCTCPT